MNYHDSADFLTGREDCLLVIIDVQEKLMPAISGAGEVAANIDRLVQFSRIAGIPVLVTEQEKLGPTMSGVRKGLVDFKPISKVHFDCFSCYDFKDQVLASGRRTLVLAGVEAHICVTQTALHAVSDFTVHIVSDAVSSRTINNKQVAIERMARAGAVITSTEMFIYELLRRAGTEEFKKALQLVK
jgi:nicotinamidase-related amidase